MRLALVFVSALAIAGCGREGWADASLPGDAGATDGAWTDAGSFDASVLDSGSRDASAGDGGSFDASARDASAGDGGSFDASAGDGGGAGDSGAGDSGSVDAGFDAGSTIDAGTDAGRDAGTDAGGGGCISGATGTHSVRFRWAGSGSGSTAYVVYEGNTLPDTSRWHVSAASSSIGYTPVFRDPFLGVGGLDLEGTAFIDVELSTAGLSSIRNVTIAIFGRSYATTTSGSFTWQTFSGTGAAPSGSVANSAPYEWYGANATSAFTPGDSGVLLRLRAGPPSNALIVNRVEICFDASP